MNFSNSFRALSRLRTLLLWEHSIAYSVHPLSYHYKNVYFHPSTKKVLQNFSTECVI